MSGQPDSGGMLGSYTAWAGALVTDRPGPLSLRNARWTSVEAWRRAAREKAKELLACPEVPDLKARILSTSTFQGLRVEHLAWQLPYGPETRAVLLKPENATGRLPGVVALHDHGGIKCFGYRKITRTEADRHPFFDDYQRLYYGGVPWANELARRGYAVLANDVFAFGSRRILARDLPAPVVSGILADPVPRESPGRQPEPGARPPNMAAQVDLSSSETSEEIDLYNAFAGQHESIVAKSLFSAGTTWPGVVLADDQAALSILASREDVDQDRLGCCGLSGGGLRSNLLAGMDDRIRCSVSVGFMTTWRDFAVDVSHTHTWMAYAPLLPRFLDYPEILGLRAPLPSLVLATTEDPLFTPAEVERSRDMLREVYDKAGSPDAFGFSWHPGPHKFDLPMQREAFDWIDRWLKG